MSKSRRILILKFPFSSTFGGGEKHTLAIVDKLKKAHEFWLLSTCSVLIPEFKKRHWNAQSTWAGTEPVTVKALLLFIFTAPFIWLNLFVQIIRYKFSKHIDTLYCLSLTEKVLITPWARLLCMRVIWIEHLQIERWLLQSPLRLFYVLWSRLATVVTVVEAVKTQLIQLGVPQKNIQVIYNSIDTNNFVPHPSTALQIKTSFNILFVGRLASEKGVDDLIEAIRIVKPVIPHITLTIVGKGDWQTDLEKLVVKYSLESTIKFVGFQENVSIWIQRCDVFVLPATRRETFGIVVAEALATVKPVIATNVGGLPEVVGNYGWLVEPHQPQAIANALQEVYSNYDNALHKAQAGRVHVLELFREDTMIQAYDKLFQ